MLPRRLHSPSRPSSLLTRSTLTSLSSGRRHRPIDIIRGSASRTLTTPAPHPLSAFPHLESHFPTLRSTDIGSLDVGLGKDLGINPNLDHDPNLPQHHNSNLDSHGASPSYNPSEQSHKQHSSDLGSYPTPPSPKDKGKKKSSEITDREWEIRTGEFFIVHVY